MNLYLKSTYASFPIYRSDKEVFYGGITMKSRKEAIEFCLEFPDSYEDYPFHDNNWTVMRHKSNNKIFVCIFERNGQIWLNLKARPEWCDLWRSSF